MKEKKNDVLGKTTEKIYNDVIAPSAKPIGTIFSFLPRTIRLWFSKWEKWILNGEKSLELTAEAIQQKTAQIPPENLTEPEPYVAVPAIQQLTYSFDSEDLREMYANLLVSSMNKETKYKIHPAFVDIIKQLSPDEAKLLKYLSLNPNQPLLDVHLVREKDGGYIILVHNFTNISENVCENPKGIYSYLDNLERLKLIEIPFGVHIKDDETYKQLENHPTIVQLKEFKKDGFDKVELVRKKFVLTSFAKDFINVCL